MKLFKLLKIVYLASECVGQCDPQVSHYEAVSSSNDPDTVVMVTLTQTDLQLP